MTGARISISVRRITSGLCMTTQQCGKNFAANQGVNALPCRCRLTLCMVVLGKQLWMHMLLSKCAEQVSAGIASGRRWYAARRGQGILSRHKTRCSFLGTGVDTALSRTRRQLQTQRASLILELQNSSHAKLFNPDEDDETSSTCADGDCDGAAKTRWSFCTLAAC